MPKIYIGSNASNDQIFLNSSMANRHGLIAGATGTGKTVTLRLLAENFSKLGVPVFMADIKGDLSGLCKPGEPNVKVQERLDKLKLKFDPKAFPVIFWDLFCQAGHPIRCTISEMGPLLLTRLLNLNPTQAGVLEIAFKSADDQGLLLLDLKDLKEMLKSLGENTKSTQAEYGNVTSASIAAIQRGLLQLEQSGGDKFFAEPALKFEHLMQKDFSGNGVISLLDATTLINDPKLYASFLLWLLSELFEHLPEVGDQEIPKLVFFFDEAHLLFNDAPKPLLDRIQTVVRLIRSKGVGIYFVTQNPLDIPEDVLGQLGNRIQHALRAFTPKDQKAVKAAAETFRQNPKFDIANSITELAVGEALVSFLDEKGTPSMVERILICPPQSRLTPLSVEEKKQAIQSSPLNGIYDTIQDRESAYEVLRNKVPMAVPASPQAGAPAGSVIQSNSFVGSLLKSFSTAVGRGLIAAIFALILGKSSRKGSSATEKFTKTVTGSMSRSVSTQMSNRIVRGVLGNIIK